MRLSRWTKLSPTTVHSLERRAETNEEFVIPDLETEEIPDLETTRTEP